MKETTYRIYDITIKISLWGLVMHFSGVCASTTKTWSESLKDRILSSKYKHVEGLLTWLKMLPELKIILKEWQG